MARIRTIKPEFHKHEDLSELPPETHLLAVALLNYADDEGYFNANPKLIKAECCPLREDKTTIEKSLKLLSGSGWLRLGKGPGGKRYGHIINFLEHQRVNRPYPSKIKNLDISWESSVNIHGIISEHSRQEKERNKEKEKEKNIKREFREFYSEYPNKKGGPLDAEKAYRQARRRASHEKIMVGLKAYKANKEDWRQWKQAGPWLRAGMWMAEYEDPKGEKGWDDKNPRKMSEEEWESFLGKPGGYIADFRKRNWPWGNYPDHCPPEILEKYFGETR